MRLVYPASMKASNPISTQKLGWQIFGLGLLLGAVWGVVSALFGTFVLRLPEGIGDSHFAFPGWMFAKYFVVVGMIFGVGCSSLYFLGESRAAMTQPQGAFVSLLKYALASLFYGYLSIVAAHLLFLVVAMVLGLYQGINSLVAYVMLHILVTTPLFLGSAMPMAFLMQPWIVSVWGKWYQARVGKRVTLP
jgi:hypothetical protein